MVLRVEDIKKNLWIIVKDNRSGEVQTVVHLNDTKIGTTSSSRDFEVTGELTSRDVTVARDISVAGRSMGSLDFVPIVSTGRLTLTSAVPITTTDVVSGSTLYYTPSAGAQITLWDGSAWRLISFEEKSLPVNTLAANTNVDIFGYFNDTTLSLEYGSAWTSNTLRSEEISLFNGVMCKTTNPTRRYIGSIRTTASGFFEDSISKRFVWNAYNQVPRILQIFESTDSWTYNTAAFRPSRGTTNNCFEYIAGDVATALRAQAFSLASCTAGLSYAASGIGIDSTTVNSAQTWGANVTTVAFVLISTYKGYLSAGYHTITWLECGGGVATLSFYGDVGQPTLYQFGMYGEIMG